MTSEIASSSRSEVGSRAGIVSLFVVHLLAFGMLYMVLVQIANAFQDHYRVVGYAPTGRFSSVLALSNYAAAYTWIWVGIVAADLFVLTRLRRRGNRWTSAYSHATLVGIGFAAFLMLSWLISPMVWGQPGAGGPPVAENQDVELQADVSLAAK